MSDPRDDPGTPATCQEEWDALDELEEDAATSREDCRAARTEFMHAWRTLSWVKQLAKDPELTGGETALEKAKTAYDEAKRTMEAACQRANTSDQALRAASWDLVACLSDHKFKGVVRIRR